MENNMDKNGGGKRFLVKFKGRRIKKRPNGTINPTIRKEIMAGTNTLVDLDVKNEYTLDEVYDEMMASIQKHLNGEVWPPVPVLLETFEKGGDEELERMSLNNHKNLFGDDRLDVANDKTITLDCANGRRLVFRPPKVNCVVISNDLCMRVKSKPEAQDLNSLYNMAYVQLHEKYSITMPARQDPTAIKTPDAPLKPQPAAASPDPAVMEAPDYLIKASNAKHSIPTQKQKKKRQVQKRKAAPLKSQPAVARQVPIVMKIPDAPPKPRPATASQDPVVMEEKLSMLIQKQKNKKEEEVQKRKTVVIEYFPLKSQPKRAAAVSQDPIVMDVNSILTQKQQKQREVQEKKAREYTSLKPQPDANENKSCYLPSMPSLIFTKEGSGDEDPAVMETPDASPIPQPDIDDNESGDEDPAVVMETHDASPKPQPDADENESGDDDMFEILADGGVDDLFPVDDFAVNPVRYRRF